MVRWQPPGEQVVEVRKPPRWPMVLLLLALLGVAGAGLWIIRLRMRPQRPADLSMAVGVRSEIRVAGDSLDVVVFWRLTEPASAAPADSVRIEVGLGKRRGAADTAHSEHPQYRHPAHSRAQARRDGVRVLVRGGGARPAALAGDLHTLAVRAAHGAGPLRTGGGGHRRPEAEPGRGSRRRSSGSWFSRPDSR